MKGLTLKQKLFVNEYIKTKNGTRSAMKVYHHNDKNTSASTASRLLTNNKIKMTIEKVLERARYNPIQSVNTLIDLQNTEVKRISGADKINATKLLLQLSGMLVDRSTSTSLNYNIDTYDNYKLLNVKDKYNKLIEKRKEK